MSNLRFYSPGNLAIGTTVKLSDNAAAHATRVLRLQTGDALKLFNGNGFDYDCELTSLKKNEVLATVKTQLAVENESPLEITLLQGISSGDRMDYTIQKSVELGVTHIVPINTKRSVVKLKQDRIEKRLAHWQNVMIAACEQSGRAIIPTISAPTNLADWLAENANDNSTRITLDPYAKDTLKTINQSENKIELLVGAEGGLSDEELALAKQHGFIAVQLGQRILRTETAPLAAIAVMQNIWGDF